MVLQLPMALAGMPGHLEASHLEAGWDRNVQKGSFTRLAVSAGVGWGLLWGSWPEDLVIPA